MRSHALGWVPALSRACPLCDRPFAKRPFGARRSRDHIYPQCKGGRDVMYGDSNNIRMVCVDCNALRAYAEHCVALTVCVLTVARATKRQPNEILKAWLRGRRPV